MAYAKFQSGRLLPVLVFMVFMAVLIAGCREDSRQPASERPDAQQAGDAKNNGAGKLVAVTSIGEAGSAATEAPGNAETFNVIIERQKFMPPVTEVHVGDAVEWANTDSEAHTVTFENGDSDTHLPSGGQVRTIFTELGEFRYFCQYHPGMQGSVIVR